jgi:hypothetical protein
VTYEHPRLGFSIELAEGWEVASEVPPVFLPPGAREQAFAPNVVVTSGPTGDPEATVAGLEHARLIDRVVLPGHRERTLIHHVVRQTAVTLEQWWFRAGDTMWVSSASCAALDYDERADALAAVAASLRPPS